jgi:hypothetical protein
VGTRVLLCWIAIASSVGLSACLPETLHAERRIERAFDIDSGATVEVGIGGGSITALTGPPGRVSVVVTMTVRGYAAERDAQAMLSDVQVSIEEERRVVRVQSGRGWRRHPSWLRSREIAATITVPADVALKFDTRGGRVRVRGDRVADLLADTHGGSIDVESGRGRLVLSTGGGNVRIRRALGSIQAATSGGRIVVGYVAPGVHDIDLGSAGGSIDVGIDPAARLTLLTSASGGGIRVDGLSLEADDAQHSLVEGTLNGGQGGRVRAITGGGSITVHAASDPG